MLYKFISLTLQGDSCICLAHCFTYSRALTAYPHILMNDLIRIIVNVRYDAGIN